MRRILTLAALTIPRFRQCFRLKLGQDLQFADQKPASVCILIAISVHISGRFTYETELIRSYKFLCKKQYKQKKKST